MDPCMDDDNVTGEGCPQLDQQQARPKASTDALAELPDVMIKRGAAQKTDAETPRKDLVSEEPDPKRSKDYAASQTVFSKCPNLDRVRGCYPHSYLALADLPTRLTALEIEPPREWNRSADFEGFENSSAPPGTPGGVSDMDCQQSPSTRTPNGAPTGSKRKILNEEKELIEVKLKLIKEWAPGYELYKARPPYEALLIIFLFRQVWHAAVKLKLIMEWALEYELDVAHPQVELIKEWAPEYELEVELIKEWAPEYELEVELIKEWAPEYELEVELIKEWAPEYELEVELIKEWAPEYELEVELIKEWAPEYELGGGGSKRKALDARHMTIEEKELIEVKMKLIKEWAPEYELYEAHPPNDTPDVHSERSTSVTLSMVLQQQEHLARKTKIVCTMGPACWDEECIGKLLDAGLNVARYNFSHGDHEGHYSVLQRFRKVCAAKGNRAATLLDTKGPEIRTAMLRDHKPINLEAGQSIIVESVGDRYNKHTEFGGYKDEGRPHWSSYDKLICQSGDWGELDGGRWGRVWVGGGGLWKSVGDLYTEFEGYKDEKETRIGLSYDKLCQSVTVVRGYKDKKETRIGISYDKPCQSNNILLVDISLSIQVNDALTAPPS
eukprot:gene26972-34986_t